MKNRFKELLWVLLFGVLLGTFTLFTSCQLDDTASASTTEKMEASTPNNNQTTKAVTPGTKCVYYLYKGYDGKGGEPLTIEMIRINEGQFKLNTKYCGDDYYIDLNNFASNPEWDNNIKSIGLASFGYYPSIYVFEDAGRLGGHNKVLYFNAQIKNVPAGFGISSVLPELPYDEAKKIKIDVSIRINDGNGLKYLCAENEADRPIKPNRTAVGLWETF